MERTLPNGQPLYLFASAGGEPEELAGLYFRRCEGETNIREWKVTLETEQLRGRSVETIEKELLSSLLAYNLTTQVRRLAAEQARVKPRRLSFSVCWYLVKAFLQLLSLGLPESELQERFDRMLRNAGRAKLPNRKKPRSYPRRAYARRRKYPPRKVEIETAAAADEESK